MPLGSTSQWLECLRLTGNEDLIEFGFVIVRKAVVLEPLLDVLEARGIKFSRCVSCGRRYSVAGAPVTKKYCGSACAAKSFSENKRNKRRKA